MSRPTLATLILGGCTGCHLSLLDAHEGLLEVLGEVDLLHSPFTPGDEIPEVDVALVEGAVQNERDLRTLKEARERAGRLVALGSCACLGGIGGLRNLGTAAELRRAVYGDPETPEDLPRLEEWVRPLHDFVKVDARVPGCSPPTENILAALDAMVAGETYEEPRHTLCKECARVHDKMLEHSDDFITDAVYSVMELDEIESDVCFLEQGVLCMGPVTRVGCGARCVDANVPCRGCMGTSRSDFEQGAKAVDVLGAILPAGAIMFMDDLIGTAYRYTTPVSIFPRAQQHGGDDDA